MANNKLDHIKIEFEKFLSLIGNVLIHEKEIKTIQNKLRRHFNTASSTYLCSTDFQSLLNDTENLFNENGKSTKYFSSLVSLDEQFKKNNIKSLGSNHEDSNPVNNLPIIEKTVITSTTNEHDLQTSSIEPSINSCEDEKVILTESQISITNVAIEINNQGETKREKKIRKLEKRLSNLSKTIRQLEEKDMTLDEMQHCDLYVVESNLKQRAYEIFNKLALLKNESLSIERVLEQPIILTDFETDYPLINKELEDMVNQTKYLPSFNEVLITVEKANIKHELNLSVDIQKKLAEKLFKTIGKKIKDRRMADFSDIMKSRLPENFDIEQNDPASTDSELENALLMNNNDAAIKTEQIFEEFSQIDPHLEPEINIESSDETINDSDEESVQSESEQINNKTEATTYDIVDILPPFSSKSSSPAEPTVSEKVNHEDPVETRLEISINQRRLKVLSTASIPVKSTAPKPFIPMYKKNQSKFNNDIDQEDKDDFQSTTKDEDVQTLIPRRRESFFDKKTVYNLYQQRLTNNSPISEKRSASNDDETSNRKTLKKQSEIIILD